MKKSKKILAVFLILICPIGLIACGESKPSNPEKVLEKYIEYINSINYEKALNLTNGESINKERFNEIIETLNEGTKDLPIEVKNFLENLKISNIERVSDSENSVTLSFTLESPKANEEFNEIIQNEIFEVVVIEQDNEWKIDIENRKSDDFIQTLIP